VTSTFVDGKIPCWPTVRSPLFHRSQREQRSEDERTGPPARPARTVLPDRRKAEAIHPTALKVQERLAARGLAVEVQELPDSTRTAAEAAAACGCETGQIVKSLVFVVDDKPTMVLCAGDRRVAKIAGRPASAEEARAATGFAIGGIPPLGHDRDLPTIVDESLRRFDRVWCAAGTPNAVFETSLAKLLAALPDASIQPV
jgi:prolyl-tRNA editing enzyme YbaK/EbsC (Cys-tRNA(Pro) deacylase)